MGEVYDVDLVVIGSGGAAMSAAIAASQAGKSVVLVERGVLGGTCVNIGCVPSKTLLAAAGTRHAALTNPLGGASTSAGPVDLGALVAQKDALVERLRDAKYADVAAAYGFEVRSGQATFVDKDVLAVDGEALRARAYLVATGSTPAVPEVTGLDSVDWLTSTTAMELTELPESLVVIGGGYVGMEQAQLFAHLGARVSVVGRLAPRAEPELAHRLRGVFADDGITVLEEHATAVTTDAGPGGQEVVVSTASGGQVRKARLMVATGRFARTDGLDLAAAGVDVDEGASWWSTRPSAPTTRASTPPVMSRGPRSTSTSPRPAVGPPRSTPSRTTLGPRQHGWITLVCLPSCSPGPSWPRRG